MGILEYINQSKPVYYSNCLTKEMFENACKKAFKDQIIERAYNRARNDFEKKIILNMDNMKDYPKQTNEHNALDDARWNYELYKFLNTL